MDKIYNDYMAHDPYTVQLVSYIETAILALLAALFLYLLLKRVFSKRAPRPYDVNPASTKQTLVNESNFAGALAEGTRYFQRTIRNEGDLFMALQNANDNSDRLVKQLMSIWRLTWDKVMNKETRDRDLPDIMMRMARNHQEALDKAYADMRAAQNKINHVNIKHDEMETMLTSSREKVSDLERSNTALMRAAAEDQRLIAEFRRAQTKRDSVVQDSGKSVNDFNEGRIYQFEQEAASRKTSGNTKPPEKAPAEKDKTDTDQTDDKKAGGKGGK